jgi:hypothetical protein
LSGGAVRSLRHVANLIGFAIVSLALVLAAGIGLVRAGLGLVPRLDVWVGDGRQPDTASSYLTACVFYAMLTDRDPVGDPFTDGLGSGEARILKEVARNEFHPT